MTTSSSEASTDNERKSAKKHVKKPGGKRKTKKEPKAEGAAAKKPKTTKKRESKLLPFGLDPKTRLLKAEVRPVQDKIEDRLNKILSIKGEWQACYDKCKTVKQNLDLALIELKAIRQKQRDHAVAYKYVSKGIIPPETSYELSTIKIREWFARCRCLKCCNPYPKHVNPPVIRKDTTKKTGVKKKEKKKLPNQTLQNIAIRGRLPPGWAMPLDKSVTPGLCGLDGMQRDDLPPSAELAKIKPINMIRHQTGPYLQDYKPFPMVTEVMPRECKDPAVCRKRGPNTCPA